MLDLLKRKPEQGNGTVAVYERPPVLEAKRALEEARAKFNETKAHLDKIKKVLTPATETSSSRLEHTDEIAIIRARLRYEPTKMAYWEAEAALKTAEQVFQKTVNEEIKALTFARAETRRGLVQQLFAKLEEAKAVAEEISGYDLETTTLGATAQMHPFGELLDEPHRTGSVTFRRQWLEKEGVL